jgi:predicted TIM-barrel fold metal-dependent hydrolase
MTQAETRNVRPGMIVVSGDSHVGPRLREDLRPYCPSAYLEEFDTFTEANLHTMEDMEGPDPLAGRSSRAGEVAKLRQFLNRNTPGHYDVNARLREMDWDGVAAEVIFHGSQNTEVFPFAGFREWAIPDTQHGHDLVAVGYRMYNRWLADFVSADRNRLIGLAYVPMWDVDLAVREVEFAAKVGLRGINFPAPRPGIAEYDDPQWENFWSACEAHGLNLATHAGRPGPPTFGPQRMAMMRLEACGWPARRAMHRMIFGGVFARHPGVKLILTELSRGWWVSTMRELDFVYCSPSEALRSQVPLEPSQYMRSNVFIGSSFTPPSEVAEAVHDGYADQMLWGRDYPHGEGTYKYPESDAEGSLTRDYLRWAFSGSSALVAEGMLSDTPIRAYGLDRRALRTVAERIGPTLDDVIGPMDPLPAERARHLVDFHTGEMATEATPIGC